MVLELTKLPERQIAIIANESGDLVVSKSVPLPCLAPDMVLVRTVAVALNPVDVKLTGSMATIGATAGCDFAGTVASVGPGVLPSKFSVGDRIAGVVPGMNPESPRVGAFGEYVGAYVDFAWKIPADMSFQSTATLGVSVTIVGYALYRSLKIPGHPEKPASKPQFVLVYGGSTAAGTMAIQLVHKSGLSPITTCSPHNFELVRTYGAEKAFDYHDPHCAAEIRAYTSDTLFYALDCFCEPSSMRICYAAIGRAGGRYATLEPYPEDCLTRKAIKPEWLLGPVLLGKRVGWRHPYSVEPDPDLYSFGKEWFLCVQRMLDTGQIRPHPIRVDERVGFEGILDGTKLIKNRAISGQKLVYCTQATPEGNGAHISAQVVT
ncbi:GroES-like protein [Hypoxylon sp. NC1633]|nr:GroES-like protein [Hypoxylon sp. NC1633]